MCMMSEWVFENPKKLNHYFPLVVKVEQKYNENKLN